MQVRSIHHAIKRAIAGFNIGVQITFYSVLFSHLTFIPYVHANPAGGNVVGGSGNINQSGLNTTINQSSQLMAIDWQSYNVQADERVQYIQPNASSISLNRILSNSGSTIAGRIDANGHVILVNPNGVFFTPTAIVNVGGMVASGLDISADDFMNGHYIFNEVLGSEGAVINSGTVNASLGGNVALIGRSVENNGLISANLGTVNLAAGKQAVLTFDNNGLLGVRVSKEILQNELGVDAAVLNSGNIVAAGGRVLLTGSVSQDIFSQAVNTGTGMQAKSVVMNADGTFALGAGADVVNSGSISVSADNTAGQIVMLGENVTSSGSISADTDNGDAGQIELHARDITALTQNSMTTARAEHSGAGGDIKVLGNKVGVFDNSTVDASGANAGGEVLIGGDKQGLNDAIRNADFIYLADNSAVHADALDFGNGGKIITFANDAARLYGNLFARGGLNGGNGGFIETSGLKYFQITKAPNISAYQGSAGEWLIDPGSINIVAGGVSATTGIDTVGTSFTSNSASSDLGVDLILSVMTGGAIVNITTGPGAGIGDIEFSTNLNYNGPGNNTLVLNAANHINTRGFDIRDNSNSGNHSLNIEFNADYDGNGNGDVSIVNSNIDTNGGTFTASGVNFNLSRTNSANDTLDTGSGHVTLNMTGDVQIGAEIFTHGGNFTVASAASGARNFNNFTANGGIDVASSSSAPDGNIEINTRNNINLGALTLAASGETSTGSIVLRADTDNLNGGDVIVNSNIATNGGNFSVYGVDFNSTNTLINTSSSSTVTDGGHIDLNMRGNVILGSVTTENTNGNGNLNIVAAGDITDATGAALNINGRTTLSTASTRDIILNNAANDFNSSVHVINARDVTLADADGIELGHTGLTFHNTGNLIINAGGIITQLGALDVDGTSSFTAGANRITLTNTSNDFGGAVSFYNSNANNVSITDANALVLGASSVGTGTLTVNAVGISQTGAITQSNSAGTVMFNGGAGAIGLTQNNNLNGEVVLNNSGLNNVALTNNGSVNLGASTVGSGSLTVTAGEITQLGAITQAANAGAATFNAGANAITLTHNGNNFTGAVSLNNSGNNDISVRDVNGINLGASSVGTGAFTVNAIGITQTGGAIIQAASADNTTFNAGAGVIQLTQANDFTGRVILNNTGANNVAVTDISNLNLGTTTVGSGTLTVTANGITQSGDIIQEANAGAATFNGGTGAITLNRANNDFTGSVSLNGASNNNVIVTNRNAIRLGTSNIGNGTLTVNAAGITQDGAITQANNAGLTTFNAGNAIINLTQNNNFTGAVSLNNTGNNNVAVTDINAINLGATTVGSGTLTVTAVGITQSGDITQSSGNGSATFNGGAGVITLNRADNDFTGAVSLNNSGTHNVVLTSSNAIRLGVSNVGSGSLTVNAAGILQSGGLTQAANADAATFNGGNGIIALTQDNDFTGAVSLNNTGSNNVAVIDTNAIVLGASSVGTGSVSVNATGITQTGALVQGANAGSVDLNGGNGDVLLENSGNNFTGTVSVNTVSLPNNLQGNVRLADVNNIRLGASDVGADFTVTAGANSDITQIDQSGADGISVGGLATFRVNGGRSISLVNNDNNFTAISFETTTLAPLQNVAISNSGGLDFGSLTLSGDLNATAGGDITNTSGILSVAGTTVLDAGSGNSIYLTNSLNNFNNVEIVAANNISINDFNDINITSNAAAPTPIISGNLTLTAGGAITDGNAIRVNGLTSLNAGAGIALNASSNDFNTVTFNAIGDVALSDANSIDLGTGSSNGLGGLQVIAGGNITNNNGALSIAGASTFTAGQNGNVSLTDTGNVLTGALTFNTANNTALSNITVNNTVATRLESLAVNNALIINSGGDITDTNLGSLLVTGTATMTANGNNILLDGDNRLTNLTVSNANNLSLIDANASGLRITNVNVTGAADIVTAGNAQVDTISAGNMISLTSAAAIVDVNADLVNMTAPVIVMNAATGIGVPDGIETQTGVLNVVNNTSGSIVVNNTGNVVIERLHNSGDITLNNDANIFMYPGSVNAGYDVGSVFMSTTSGSFLGLDATPPFSNADITARTARFVGFRGTFGSSRRPLVLSVRDSVFINTRASLDPRIEPSVNGPVVENISLFQFDTFDTVSAISGEQLVEVESAADIDPAIFTAVRNYNYDDISLRLPSDQLYEDDVDRP